MEILSSIQKYLLNAQYVPGTIVGFETTSVNKIILNICLQGVDIPLDNRDNMLEGSKCVCGEIDGNMGVLR